MAMTGAGSRRALARWFDRQAAYCDNVASLAGHHDDATTVTPHTGCATGLTRKSNELSGIDRMHGEFGKNHPRGEVAEAGERLFRAGLTVPIK